jgi:F-type H+-transporting ATPase subunit gamma
MQMIATAKFTASVQRANATKPYSGTVRELVEELSAKAGDVEHPLLKAPEQATGRELLLVISSDRGLCGAYNANVLRSGLHHLRAIEEHGGSFDLEISGKKAQGFFKFQKITPTEKHLVGDRPAYEEVEAIATRYMEAYESGKYDAVRVAYMRFYSNAKQRAEVAQLLPLTPAVTETPEENAASGRQAPYEFSPSAEELLESLLPLAVKSQLFQFFNDAVVSEQIMRMVAMKAATENAKDLKRTLNRDYNRARQAQITTELSEIIAGSAALE